MPNSNPSGCLLAIFRIFGLKYAEGAGAASKTKSTSLPYKRKDWLLSKAERSFFGVLQQAVGNQHLIFAKVRLADLLWMPKGVESHTSHQNRINAKHVDFVLCDCTNVRPLLAIELDDSSHEREDRQERDEFVAAALKAAGLPLLRLPCKAGYNVNEVAGQIQAAIEK